MFRAYSVIVNVSLKHDSILLKLMEPSNGIIRTKVVPKEVFNYKVIVDTSGTYDDLRSIPHSVKRFD